LKDSAYDGDETRQLALDLGFIPVVPPQMRGLSSAPPPPGYPDAAGCVGSDG
jgi:hypothetical protein